MKKSLCIILVLLSTFSFSQDYVAYYTQLNQAKLLAVDSNYKEAVEIYKSTFETFEFEFARDCIHAVEVSALTTLDNYTGYFIECALRRGVPISYFKNDISLTVFRNTKQWKSVVSKAFDLREEYLSGIDSSLRSEINQMFKEDQEMRKKHYHWSNILTRLFTSEKWQKLNAKQVDRLIEITKQKGFPGEQLIGIDIPDYHEKIASNQFSAGMPIIIFLHHYSQPNITFDSLLFNEVSLGRLNNEHFAGICDFEAHFGKNKYPTIGYYGIRQKHKDYKAGAYESKRKEIGLLTDAELKKLNKSPIFTKFWNRLK